MTRIWCHSELVSESDFAVQDAAERLFFKIVKNLTFSPSKKKEKIVKLSLDCIKTDAEKFINAGISLPSFDIEKMKQNTENYPTWLHFGAGNIFRGYIADLAQKMLEQGLNSTGIFAVAPNDFDIVDSIYKKFDNLTLFVGLTPNGNNQMHVIASVAKAFAGDCTKSDFENLKQIAKNPSLQLISFTITEKGYKIFDIDGKFLPIIQSDIENGPKSPKHTMSFVTALLFERYLQNKAPLALVSMDNCSHNGDILKNSILCIANEWQKKGFVDKNFIEYLSDKKTVSFPCSMIDKITPRPDFEIAKSLTNLGIEGMKPIVTKKNTYLAPFVNAEIPQYLVIEDDFPNGRPPLEKVGVFLTTRERVEKSETMKVTTCLNPLHTALAILGCLLGFNKIADEMNDKDLRNFVTKLAYNEALPVVVDPEIINPAEFLNEVLTQRLPNPFLPDTPQRIATDTSQKIVIRFGETIKSYVKKNKQGELIPIVIAAWLRYLMAIDDNGNKIELSSDPMLEELKEKLSIFFIGMEKPNMEIIKEILQNKSLFALNLCEIGLDEKICKAFLQMISKIGSVRQIVHDAVV